MDLEIKPFTIKATDFYESDQAPTDFCEKNYPETCKEFQRLQRLQYNIFCKKQMDYGPSNIALGTPLSKSEHIKASLTGIVIRANDKMQRLLNLIVVNGREPVNESIADSFVDLAVYSNIALIVQSGKWGK